RIRKVRANATAASQNSQKRELELLRRIAILLGIYLTSGIPSILFMVTSIRLIYMINLVSPSVVVCVEKICTILLDREMCQMIRAKVFRLTPVTPFATGLVLLTNVPTQRTVRHNV
ncbi:unnamed protein product, partial [Adineta ricciae]